MLLNEMFQPAPEYLQDLSMDNSAPRLEDSRKTKLTLRQITKLRKMQELSQYEHAKNLKKVRAQYGPPAQPAGGMGL